MLSRYAPNNLYAEEKSETCSVLALHPILVAFVEFCFGMFGCPIAQSHFDVNPFGIFGGARFMLGVVSCFARFGICVIFSFFFLMDEFSFSVYKLARNFITFFHIFNQ